MTQNLDWNWTNTVNYTNTFAEKHNINAVVGFTAEKFADYWVYGSRDAVPGNSDTLQEVHAGTLNQNADGNTSYNTLISYLARAMYNFDGRYYLTASLRNLQKAINTPRSLPFPQHGESATRHSCAIRM